MRYFLLKEELGEEEERIELTKEEYVMFSEEIELVRVEEVERKIRELVLLTGSENAKALVRSVLKKI